MPLVGTPDTYAQNLQIPGITQPSALACIARSRTYKQYLLMVDQALSGICPFCKPDETVNRVIANTRHWRAWQSPAPEKHTKHHFILTPKEHVVDTEELTASAKLEMFRVMEILRSTYKYTSRGILIRDGDATLSAGTIRHLHVHIMVPDGTGRVESPFYKGSADEILGVYRARVFEKMRRGATFEELSHDEQRLVEGRMT